MCWRGEGHVGGGAVHDGGREVHDGRFMMLEEVHIGGGEVHVKEERFVLEGGPFEVI